MADAILNEVQPLTAVPVQIEALPSVGLADRGALSNYAQLNVGDRPNLVLLDLDLPGLDGKMVLRSIRNKYALRFLPAIVLSSSSSATDIADAYDLNADAYDLNANAYIVKPQEISGYLDMVKTLSAFWLNLAQLPTDLHHVAFL